MYIMLLIESMGETIISWIGGNKSLLARDWIDARTVTETDAELMKRTLFK